jgi:hypothetical protein
MPCENKVAQKRLRKRVPRQPRRCYRRNDALKEHNSNANVTRLDYSVRLNRGTEIAMLMKPNSER